MRISYKILIINFAIVLLVLGTAAAAFYSIMYNVLATQQSKFLLGSANDFLYAYRENIASLEEEYFKLSQDKSVNNISLLDLNDKKIDFILYVSSKDKSILEHCTKKRIFVSDKTTLEEFFYNYPYTITNITKTNNGTICYYGRLLTNELLDEFAKRIRSEIAIIWKSFPSQLSNETANQKYIYALKQSFSELANRRNFDFTTQQSEASDLLVTIYKPPTETNVSDIRFLIFSSLNTADVLRNSIRDIVVIIGFSGVFLAIILTFLFTSKIRNRITDLSEATKVTKLGNFKNRIKVTSNDELGELAGAFNIMLDELDKNQKLKNEYAEFITLLNQNPSLKEISTEALKKIIHTCGFSVGAIYSVDEDNIEVTSSYGIKDENPGELKLELFRSVIKNKESMRLLTGKDLSNYATEIIDLNLKYLLVLPIIYNSKVISVLEMSGPEKPTDDAIEYLSRIQEQLAIGLMNAFAFVQLEKLVSELKDLNEDYQKQNIQIRKQNETLVELHSKLKEKADELAVQKEKAEESTKLKSQFLASMSHELRTPMNSILGLSELILTDSSFKGRNRERLEVVLKSSRRLMTLINDILDLTKIEAGKVEIREENVLLQEMLKEIEYSVSPLFLNKDIQFRIKKEINCSIIINTDRGKVTQVLINLIGNAAKFTEKGFVDLRIYFKEDNLAFDVSDSGIGISEEHQSIIFEEFRQIDGTISKKYNGTGLGLTICKKIADVLNGTISLKSKTGIGSVFTFTIPFNLVEEVNPEYERKRTIQVIEENEEARITIGDYLIGLNYDVVFSEDGESGFLDAIKYQPFTIVLDSNLPNKDGWDVVKYLKEDSRTTTIPVIMFTILPGNNVGYGLNIFEFLSDTSDERHLKNIIEKLENSIRKRVDKIIIVDKNEDIALVITGTTKEKHEIIISSNMEKSFAEIQKYQPDIIFLNPLFNDQNVFTLFHKLKNSKETKNIPVVIVLPKVIDSQNKERLIGDLTEIALKSKTHPLDVLKIIRDRIRSEEVIAALMENKKIEKLYNEDDQYLTSENNDQIGEILVIDDDADTLFTINEILVSCNCSTYLARGGKEGLKILENKIPDLILLDIMMPEMDGFQTIKHIKEIPHLADIPVFAVTAKAMLQDKDIILRNGFADYIPKPINASSLSLKIRQTLLKLKTM